jgi:glycosyltransferase involved in cell wall biosynthesis
MRKPFVSVVIPAYNEEVYIKRCLDSVLKQDYGSDNYEVLVVDNNSADKTSMVIREFPGVKYLFKEKGPVGAVRNFGVEKSRGEIIAFLDSDCIAPSNWISAGVELLGDGPGRIFGGKYLIDGRGTWVERCWLLPSKMKLQAEKDLLGGCIFIYRSDFLSVGGFSEGITSGEDSKLSVDLKARGCVVVIMEAINVIHLGNPKTVGSFIKRQIWHSENYIEKFRDFIFDPTFHLSSFFGICLIFFIFSIAFASVEVVILFVFPLLMVPMVFSVKRLARSDLRRIAFFDILGIYILDFFYLFGRTLGILKGIKTTIFRNFKK